MPTDAPHPVTTGTGALTDEEREVTEPMIDAAMVEYRSSDFDGRALVRSMIAQALAARAGGQQTQAEAALDDLIERFAKYPKASPYPPWRVVSIIKAALAALPERAPTQAEQAVERARAVIAWWAEEGSLHPSAYKLADEITAALDGPDTEEQR